MPDAQSDTPPQTPTQEETSALSPRLSIASHPDADARAKLRAKAFAHYQQETM